MIMLQRFALVLLVVLPATVLAQEEPDVVHLRFAWPEHFSATVEHEMIRIRQSAPERIDSFAVSAVYSMNAMPHAEGRLIRSDLVSGPEIHGANAVPSDLDDAPSDLLQPILASLAPMTTGSVISDEGEFIRLEDTEITVEPLMALLQEAGVEAEVLPILTNLFSPEMVSASAAMEWGLLVGMWIDAEWEVGAVYALEAEQESPLVPGLTVPTYYEFSITGRVPCTHEATTDECVELEMYSATDPDAVLELLTRLMGDLANDDMNELREAPMSMYIEHELLLVTDPATLLPYYMEVTKYVEADSPDDTGEAGESEWGEDVRVITFTYHE